MGPLTSTDGSRSGWPGAELRGLQFTDGSALAGFPVLADGLLPGRLRCIQNRLPDPGEEVQADRESQPQLPSSLQQRIGGAGAVAAEQDLAARSVRQLRQRHLQDLDVVAGVIGRGVARPQFAGERLLRLLQVADDGMKAVPVLEVGSRRLLVGVRVDQRGVEIEDDLLRRRAQPPGSSPSLSAGRAEPLQILLAHPPGQHPPGRCRGRHLAKQTRLVT